MEQDYLNCEKRPTRPHMKEISVCHKCLTRGKCTAYQEYLQPSLWGSRKKKKRKRIPS